RRPPRPGYVGGPTRSAGTPGGTRVPQGADRGGNPKEPDPPRSPRGPGPPPPGAVGGGRGIWGRPPRLVHPSFRPVVGPAAHRGCPLQPARHRLPAGGAPPGDLRDARPRGDRRPRPAHRHDEPGALLPAPHPGPVHFVAVLDGTRDRPQVLSP